MTLPGKCPSCGSTELREQPQGGYHLFRYKAPKVNIRNIGTAAKAHNKNAMERLQQASRALPTEIVVCAKCGAVYAKELEG